MVPEANRSPVRAVAPLTVQCASIWAGDQYMWAYGGRETISSFHSTSRSMFKPQSWLPRKYGRGSGSWVGVGTRADSNAAMGTTHGEMDVAKLLPRNGPNGTYSHARMSRADQSLTMTSPQKQYANS